MSEFPAWTTEIVKRHQLHHLAACSAVIMLLICSTAEAGKRDDRHLAQATAEEPPHANDRREAAEIARKRSGGRVLSSEPIDTEEGRPAYRVKVLTPEGHIRVLVIDGKRKRND